MTNEIQTIQRIAGYDLARAVAIFGMVVHHFELTMVADADPLSGLARWMIIFDGRPAALFLILAGVGITLLSRRAVDSGDVAQIARVRMTFLKRGLLLFGLGYLNLLVWPGDILRIYGVSLVLAAWLFDASDRRLLCVDRKSVV